MAERTTSGRKTVAREREQQALDMRKAGWSYARIGEALGISSMGAHKIVMRILDRMAKQVGEDAIAVRQIELQRLDAMLEAAWDEATTGNLKAIDTCLRIQERRSKFLGLDSAQKVDLSGTIGVREYVGVPVDQV